MTRENSRQADIVRLNVPDLGETSIHEGLLEGEKFGCEGLRQVCHGSYEIGRLLVLCGSSTTPGRASVAFSSTTTNSPFTMTQVMPS
jgi:hypothetical protein